MTAACAFGMAACNKKKTDPAPSEDKPSQEEPAPKPEPTPEPTPALAYTLNADESGYTVTGRGNVTGGTVEIPAEYDGKPVTAIGDKAFESDQTLTSVSIPDSVTKIGKSAFFNCSGLTNVNLGKSVEDISETTFSQCTKLKRIDIPDSVTAIGANAFLMCNGLEGVILGKGIKNVGSAAFYGCTIYTVYYKGTQDDWKNIAFESLNDPVSKNADVAYYRADDPSASGLPLYWHYAEDGITPVIWDKKS